MRAHERFEVQETQKNNDHHHHHRFGGFVGGGGGGGGGNHDIIGGAIDDDDRRPDGFVVTRSCVCVTAMMFTFLLCAAILLTYNFGKCSNINVQSEVCDKKNVIPITIALNDSSQSVDDDAMKAVQFEEDINRSNRTNIRLPKTMHPLHYELKLMPFLMPGNFTFGGDARITVNVTESCQNITLHANALRIGTVRIWNIGNATQTPQQMTLNHDDGTHEQQRTEMKVTRTYSREPDQLFIIIFDTALQPNNIYEIHIQYTGVLNDMLQGFYRSSYDVNNQTRWLAVTQFQPTDARRAFPCFDEPAFKAKFKIWMARPADMISLSNMPKMGTPTDVDTLPGYLWDEFEESVPMSTYLVAFVVCDFKNLTDGRVSVWARPEAIESARYALDVAPKILKFFENYFNIKYPLPKLDLIALPDFSAGAMENWGLVTFREVTMLHDEKISAPLNKQRVSSIIAHEIVHQWFGNLVTPSWWSDLWLNEGFASYMEYVGANMINPGWKVMDQFLCNEVQPVLILDSLASSHEISVHVQDPDSINEIFDRISYGKGAAIIRMMEHFLTTKVFRDGLHSYLTERAYQVAAQDDLWSHLTESAQESNTFDNLTNVKDIMDGWTTKMGFPVVNVTRNYETNVIEFAQSRFTFIAPNQWKSLQIEYDEDTLWWIPLSYTTMNRANFSDTKPKDWIRGIESFTKDFKHMDQNAWIIVNIQGTGYYRVNYDVTNWRLLANYLQNPKTFAKIAATNRAQIVDDALTLARAGKLDYRIALNLTRYLVNEFEYVPWRSALGALNFIDSMMSSGPDYHLLKHYIFKLIHKIYMNVTTSTNTKDPLLAYKRIDITTFACRMGFKDCVDHSLKAFSQWMNVPNPDRRNDIAPNERAVVYCTAIKYGTDDVWDFVWNRYMNANVSSEKELLLDSLACSREPWILARFLDRTITENSGVRKQDLIRVFVTVSNNPIGIPVTYTFLRSNWERIKNYLGPPPMNMYVILMYVFKNANTHYDLTMFRQFIKENISEKSRILTQAVESVKTNINWMDQNYETIVDWLTNEMRT